MTTATQRDLPAAVSLTANRPAAAAPEPVVEPLMIDEEAYFKMAEIGIFLRDGGIRQERVELVNGTGGADVADRVEPLQLC